MEIHKAKEWQRPGEKQQKQVFEKTSIILNEIREKGADGIDEFSLKFDGFRPYVIPLKPFEAYPLDDSEKSAIRHAAQRITTFAKLQRTAYRDVEITDSCGTFGHKVLPLDSMVAYIPGGRFPLISTALMTLIPAKVAGVERRVAFSPSDHPAIQAAASLAGATEMWRIGGVQAMATAAFGYRNFPPVDMVVGPGNAFVNAAKALLQSTLKIDTLAGPSELLILADKEADPNWVCLDMLAQAEHDPQALSVLCSNDTSLLHTVKTKLEAAAKDAESVGIGVVHLVHADRIEDMIHLSNRMAPEHLHVNAASNSLDPSHLKNYGSLFLGPLSAVALGDYCSGPNHTLPTSGYAQKKGGLHVGDFLKVLTYQEVHAEGMKRLAKTGISLAQQEGLKNHSKSLAIRCDLPLAN